MEISIYNQEDRLAVAQILVKNGYKVCQGKRAMGPSGKQVDYTLRIEETEEKVRTR